MDMLQVRDQFSTEDSFGSGPDWPSTSKHNKLPLKQTGNYISYYPKRVHGENHHKYCF